MQPAGNPTHPRLFSAAQAQAAHRFYGSDDLVKYPQMFNQRPDEFNFKALLAECGIGEGDGGVGGGMVGGGEGASASSSS